MSEKFQHICFIAPYAFPLLSGDEGIQLIGGAELQMVIVARLLAARGHRVSMICLDFGQEDEIELDGVKVFRAYKPEEGIPILRFLWPRLTSVWQCLKRADADIYYQQTADMLTGVMAAFCKRHGRKCVFASASNPDLVPNTPRIRYARDRWIYSYGLRNVDRIFVQNEEQKRLCRENLGRESNLVPNCYAMPMKRSADGAANYILWVSTIRKLKQPELFLDLAEALPSYRFKMIGGPGLGEVALFESIQARATALENVQFLGFLPFSRAEDEFDQALLFVNTSESEGVPNAFLQAWARGVPTVSFIDAGARLDGKAVGLTANSFDELVAAVRRLAADDTARLQEGRRCAAYVEINHSPEKVVRIYEQAFTELAKAESRAPTLPISRNEHANTDDPKR